MENFVLYEELGRGESSIIYKGRRKGTIHFVAIHCIEKCKRAEVTNTVRMTHDISHTNVVKFYEWYETSNHLWLVVELCTGGSLEMLTQQDKYLPESSVRTFGIDLVTGIHYIHSLGILFCDLRPSKILLDGSGILKYADFGLSKVEGENLEELFEKFSEAGGGEEDGTTPRKYKTQGSATYMAPEVLQGADCTIASDLWSLGVVFYECFTGHPPFLAESFQQLKDKIINKDMPVPKVKGTRFSAKPSPDFLNLLESLMQKDPDKRLGWPGLVTHPFWQDKCSHLAKDLVLSQEVQGSTIATTRSSVFIDGTGSVLGKVKTLDTGKSTERPVSNLDLLDVTRPGSTMGDYMRPKTAPGSEGGENLFTLSARPHTSVAPDERVGTPHKPTQSPLSTREPIGATPDQSEATDSRNEILDLIYHPSDFQVSQIVDNSKIQKPTTAKYDSKILPVPPYSVEKLNSMSEKEWTKHVKSIVECLSIGEKGPPSQKRIHLLHYLTGISTNSMVATALVKQGILTSLCKVVKDTTHLDVKGKAARVIGLLSYNTADLDESVNLSEPLTILTECIRENAKNAKLKQTLLPALGEILYLVATQEQTRHSPVENWNVPSMTYTVVTRSCREGEDVTVHHIAAKIVENVVVTTGYHAQKFVTNEMGQALWFIFKHSTVDSLRITAISALCRITKQNPKLFQSVIDTVGVTTILSTLSFGITRIQQAIVTMFGVLIASGSFINRLVQDKYAALFKLFCTLFCMIQHNRFFTILNINSCYHTNEVNNSKSLLVNLVRMDKFNLFPCVKRVSRGIMNTFISYRTYQCIDCYFQSIIIYIFYMKLIFDIGTFCSFYIRLLFLKSPNIYCIFILTDTCILNFLLFYYALFVKYFIVLLLIKTISNFNVVSSSITASEFVNTSMSVLEGLSQHPVILAEYSEVILEKILPTLADLIGSQNGDTRALSLRLFTEVASVYLSQDQFGVGDVKVNTSLLHKTIGDNLLPQFEQILLDQDPLPAYGLKLLLALLEQNPAFIKQFEQLGLVSVIFQVLLDHQQNPLNSAMQSIAGIINCLVSHKETNMQELYEQGLIDYFTTLIFEVSAVCFEGDEHGGDSKTAVVMLQMLLDTLNSIFKYVSDVVRKALQSKKSGGEAGNKEAEDAEMLLLNNKPLTDLTSLLTQLLCHEDTDIHDLSTKCISLLVQLFGGENKDSLSPENMDYYRKALQKADAKKQKVLLRIIKRLLSTEKAHIDMMKQHGDVLANTIKNLVQTGTSHADVALSSLAGEILKMTGYLK
ncbi:serine/threonine-protein kinase ULK4 [Mytilus galloprovincialis]|uniref:Serine/threonine-protein kinase ULK4 n=1 Tax=Mytilus galloprovincialis TaxID=29158 RepID=A0A8B6G1D1_MYTGA|nr:serine/threonine-protein kinase ULK4 [Mytilus galloprovincialis]